MSTVLRDRIRAARGEVGSDLVLEGARIVNVFTGEITPGAVAIKGDTIVAVGELPDGAVSNATTVVAADGRYLVPGYIDAHMHVGGSYAPVGALASALVARGTTTLATDMYEMYAMAGIAGVEESIDHAEAAGLRVLFMTPAHLIGLDEIGTFAHPPELQEFLAMGEWERTIAVNEPPPFVVLGENNEVLTVIGAALQRRNVFEGHAVGVGAAALQAYAAAGASSDHEAITLDEARDRLRLGFRIIMREGSAARDLAQLAPLLLEFPLSSRFVMVCTDELEPKHLLAEGHVDHKLRLLVAAGVDPITALQTATINAADYFGLGDRLGSATPGKAADILLLDELADFRPFLVVSRGEIVAKDGGSTRPVPTTQAGDELRSRVVLAHSPRPDDFTLRTDLAVEAVDVRVIGMVPGSLVSRADSHRCRVVDGIIHADPEADVLRVAVIERHTGSGRIGRAFLSGTGIRDGAVAMTYCHVHQNLLVIGSSDEEMALAATEVARLQGGMAVVHDGEVVASVDLPVGGVLGAMDLPSMATAMGEIENAIRGLGCDFDSPVLSLAFCALPTIPAYGLTDLGLYDVPTASFVDVVLGGAA